jgi:flavin reductase (DIM6/NTAB) family NADH-FMN oxidoreductase RutF
MGLLGVTKLKRVVAPHRAIFPTPAALVTTVNVNDDPNVATAGEVFMISLRPLIVAVGFRPATYTSKLIHQTKEFVVNLPRREILEAVDYCGCVSGRKVNKFKATGLTPVLAKHVKPPLIEECPVNIECRVRDTIHFEYMDRDVFAGETLAIHIDEDILGEDGLPDLMKFEPIAFASQKYYGITDFLENMHFSTKPVNP